MSTTSSGTSQIGVNIALAGLSFQVFTLVCFIGLCLDYAIRYRRSGDTYYQSKCTRQFKIFVGTLAFAIICILIRCIYRIDELSEGYSGPLISDEGLFIGLEGVLIVIAAFTLNVVLEYKVRSVQRSKDGAPATRNLPLGSEDEENRISEK